MTPSKMIINSSQDLKLTINEALMKIGASKLNFKIESMGSGILGKTVFFKDKSSMMIFNSTLIGETKKTVLNIVAHETAHVVAGKSANHNKQWSVIANRYSTTLGSGPVTEFINDINNNLSIKFWKNNFNYVYKCSHCGKIIGSNNKKFSSINNSQYIHLYCGGRWIKI